MSDLYAIVTAHEVAPRLRTEGRGAQCSEMTNSRPAMTAFTVSPEQRIAARMGRRRRHSPPQSLLCPAECRRPRGSDGLGAVSMRRAVDSHGRQPVKRRDIAAIAS